MANNVMNFTSGDFDKAVLQSDIPVLVDFWAEWCGPCHMIAPTVAALANEYAGKLKAGKLNVDESRDIAMRYKIMSIPTVMIFSGGKAVEKSVGVVNKATLKKLIDKYV